MDQIKYKPEDLVDHDGVSAVIKDAEGRILMQEHVKYGFWTIPVGKAKKGQSVEDALKEEVLEETGLTVTNCEEISSRVDDYIRAGIKVRVIAHLFEVKEYTGALENLEPHKHKQQVFMSIDEIVKLPYLSDLTLHYLSMIGIARPSKI